MQTMKECNDQLVQQLKQKKKEQEEMKRDMMRLVEAQWNAVHRIQPTSGRFISCRHHTSQKTCKLSLVIFFKVLVHPLLHQLRVKIWTCYRMQR